MLYRTLKRMIERKNTNGLIEKIDFLYHHNELTESEYKELINLLNKG